MRGPQDYFRRSSAECTEQTQRRPATVLPRGGFEKRAGEAAGASAEACRSREGGFAVMVGASLSFLCARHNMTTRSICAAQDEDGHSGRGGAAVDPEATD